MIPLWLQDLLIASGVMAWAMCGAVVVVGLVTAPGELLRAAWALVTRGEPDA